MSRAALSLALVVTSLLGTPAVAQVADAPLAQSTFATGAEGWLNVTLPYPSAVPPTILATFAPTWISSLGGYVRQNDPDGSMPTGDCQYWRAPAAFLGNKAAAWGGSLQFDLANSGGLGPFAQEDLILVGGGLTLVHALGGTPVPAFTHYAIPLSETGWTVVPAGLPATPAQMQSALAALDDVFVRAEHQLGPDTQFLDNVTLEPGPVTGPWTNLGFGLSGTNGVPSLSGTGTLVGGSATSLDLAGAKASAPAVLFVGLSNAPTPFKGGTLVPVPSLVALSLVTSAAGAIALPFSWPTGLPPAFSIFYQYAIKDAAAVQGASLSNALRSTTP